MIDFVEESFVLLVDLAFNKQMSTVATKRSLAWNIEALSFPLAELGDWMVLLMAKNTYIKTSKTIALKILSAF